MRFPVRQAQLRCGLYLATTDFSALIESPTQDQGAKPNIAGCWEYLRRVSAGGPCPI
jgi:hypothetical protein